MDKTKYRDMFVQESREHIHDLNQFLLKLENKPDDKEYIDHIFRAAHTLKGMAATLDYHQISELSQAIESLLDKVRKGELRFEKDQADVLFKCFDLLSELVDDEGKEVDLKPYLDQLENPALEGPPDSPDLQQSISGELPTIRVKMEDLDTLVSMVGELLINKMRIQETLVDPPIETAEALMTFDRLVSQLQEQTIKVRLVPVEQIFNRFPRMVRDLAKAQSKQVKLEMDGLGIELDRSVLDAITEPLLHILRNAIDHGLEVPSERKKAKKPQSGTLRISSTRVGSGISIEVSDDGRGIDVEMIRSKAMQQKIVTNAEAKNLTDNQILALLGSAGLSGAKSLTDISGRGVGMNVVRSQVEGIGGQVDIDTGKGKGTKIRLTLPISLAIITGLLVTVAKERYLIPIANIVTTVDIENSEIRKIGGDQVFVMQEQVIPLTDVALALAADPDGAIDERPKEGKTTVIVVSKGGKSYGLIVDSFDKKQETVIKRMESFGATGPFSTASILPDGSIVLVLDPSIILPGY